MRVLVAGATGAIGIRLIRLLSDAGHSVVGTTRSPEKVDAIRAAGGEAAVADGLDAAAVRAVVMAAGPEVIVHEMTALTGGSDLRNFDRTFATTNRLRTEGLDHLIAAAGANGTRRLVAQSFCGWPYARVGGHVKTEDDPLDAEPARQSRQSLAAIRYLERTLAQATALEGVVLRYGSLYGPGTGVMDAAALDLLRRRKFPLIGDGEGWWSFIHVDDAAAATAVAVERGRPGLYNIVDDEPAPVRDWLPALAASLGAEPPRRIPGWIGRILAGDHLMRMMTSVRAGSNAKARRELGWRPVHPSWREGFAAVLAGGDGTLAVESQAAPNPSRGGRIASSG